MVEWYMHGLQSPIDQAQSLVPPQRSQVISGEVVYLLRHSFLLCKMVTRPSSYSCEARDGAVVHFPGGAVVKNPPANAGDMGSSTGLGRSHMPRSN